MRIGVSLGSPIVITSTISGRSVVWCNICPIAARIARDVMLFGCAAVALVRAVAFGLS